MGTLLDMNLDYEVAVLGIVHCCRRIGFGLIELDLIRSNLCVILSLRQTMISKVIARIYATGTGIKERGEWTKVELIWH
jgi:hypothetical protein